jgi:hypothetical protein
VLFTTAKAGERVAAAFFGIGFVLKLIVQLLLPQVGVHTSSFLDAFYAYLAVSDTQNSTCTAAAEAARFDHFSTSHSR